MPPSADAGGSLDVDLAVQVDLDSRVDREHRLGRQPAEVVGVLDRVQQRPAVGPVVQARASGQVGTIGSADSSPRWSRSTTSSVSMPVSIRTGVVRLASSAVVTGEGPTWILTCSGSRPSISPAIARCSGPGLVTRIVAGGRSLRPTTTIRSTGSVGPASAQGRPDEVTAAIIAPASIAARCQDTSLPNLNPPSMAGVSAGDQQIRSPRPVQQCGHGRQADRREVHQPGVRPGPQPPARA